MDRFWIGGNDLAADGSWVWTRGNPINYTGSYQNWDTSQKGQMESNQINQGTLSK